MSKNGLNLPVGTVESDFSMSHKSISLILDNVASTALRAYTMKLDSVLNRSVETPRQSAKRRNSLNFDLPVSDNK